MVVVHLAMHTHNHNQDKNYRLTNAFCLEWAHFNLDIDLNGLRVQKRQREREIDECYDLPACYVLKAALDGKPDPHS